MELIAKSERDLLGIDTFERAIIWSALLLRKGIRQAQLPTNSLLIFQNIGQNEFGKTVNVTVDSKIYYNSNDFLCNGGDFINHILNFSTANVLYEGEALPPTLNNDGLITEEPLSVNTLEKYFVWSASEWIKYNKQINTDDTWNSFGYFSFADENDTPFLMLKVILELDYEKYINSKNLIASVKSKLTFAENTSTTLVGSDLFGNTFLVGN